MGGGFVTLSAGVGWDWGTLGAGVGVSVGTLVGSVTLGGRSGGGFVARFNI